MYTHIDHYNPKYYLFEIRQSTMVFAEHTGLTNLYSMVRYCLNESKCRRALIARHFGETWRDTDCQGLCDVCQSIKGAPGSIASFTNAFSSSTAQEDITSIAQGFLEGIDKNKSADKRLTAMKLVETWKTTPTAKSPHFSKNKPDVEKLEKALMHSLLENVLKEDFHFTAYTTISYITTGRRAGLVRGNKAKIAMETKRTTVKPTYPNTGICTPPDMVAGTHLATSSSTPEVSQSHVDSFMGDSEENATSTSKPSSSSSALLPSTSKEVDSDSSSCSHSLLVDSYLAGEDDQSDVPISSKIKKRRLPPTIIDDDDDFVTTKKPKSVKISKSKGKSWLSSKRQKSKENDKPSLQLVHEQPTLTHSGHTLTNPVIEIDSD